MPESERFHSFLRTEFSNLSIKINSLNLQAEKITKLIEMNNQLLKDINETLSQIVNLQSTKPCLHNQSSISNILEDYSNK